MPFSFFVQQSHAKQQDISGKLSELFTHYTETALNNGMIEEYTQALGEDVLAKLGHRLGTDADETLSGNQLSKLSVGWQRKRCIKWP